MGPEAPPRKFRGTLFLIVGPSGAGKDTLIDGARAALAGDGGYVFPRRIITRRAKAGGEAHEAVTPQEFERRLGTGAFSLHWEAHGLRYALPAPFQKDLDAGRSVVVNVSRAVIAEARRRYPPVRIINVTAPPDVLAARLRARAREIEPDVADRLARAANFVPDGGDVVTLVSDGPVADMIAAFVALLRAGGIAGPENAKGRHPASR